MSAGESSTHEFEVQQARIRELQAQNKLLTEQLEAANREIEDVARFISHDLNASLRGIEGYSHALTQDCQASLDEMSQAYLYYITESSRQMARMIELLPQYLRALRREINVTLVDVSELAFDISARLQSSQPERQVQFLIVPDLLVDGDQKMLALLMNILLDNAWKFTSHHAQARIEVGEQARDGERVFFVADDGAGFDMTYVDQLFQPFQRLHSAHEFPGAGIGLATARRIIQRLGGRIWAEGQVEKGATIYFTL